MRSSDRTQRAYWLSQVSGTRRICLLCSVLSDERTSAFDGSPMSSWATVSRAGRFSRTVSNFDLSVSARSLSRRRESAWISLRSRLGSRAGRIGV